LLVGSRADRIRRVRDDGPAGRRHPRAARGATEPRRGASMRIRRSLGLSLRALFAHRVRAALAVAGVTAGVAAVVLTSAIGSGAEADIRARIESLGANLLVVRPAQVKRLVARREILGTVTTLRLEDAEAIAELEHVAFAVPGIEAPVTVKAGAS